MVMGDMEMNTDLLIIGGGPGGYGAAFRAADLGLDVIMVDPHPAPRRGLPASWLHSLQDLSASCRTDPGCRTGKKNGHQF